MNLNPNKMWEAWGRSNALYTAWCVEKGLNPYRMLVLHSINGSSKTTQKRIADYTGLSKQTVSTVIRALKAEELVSLSAGNQDRREKYVQLTEKGAAYTNDLLAPLYALETRVFDLMGADRMKQMMDSLTLYNTVFDKELEDMRNET